MKVLAFAICLFFLPLASLFGQFAGHRFTAYSSPTVALSTAVDARGYLPLSYSTGGSTATSYIVAEQPVFGDECDVPGAGAAEMKMQQNPAPCGWSVTGVATHHEDSWSAARAWALVNLASFQIDKTSIVPLGSWYVVIYPTVSVFCI